MLLAQRHHGRERYRGIFGEHPLTLSAPLARWTKPLHSARHAAFPQEVAAQLTDGVRRGNRAALPTNWTAIEFRRPLRQRRRLAIRRRCPPRKTSRQRTLNASTAASASITTTEKRPAHNGPAKWVARQVIQRRPRSSCCGTRPRHCAPRSTSGLRCSRLEQSLAAVSAELLLGVLQHAFVVAPWSARASLAVSVRAYRPALIHSRARNSAPAKTDPQQRRQKNGPATAPSKTDLQQRRQKRTCNSAPKRTDPQQRVRKNGPATARSKARPATAPP